MSATLKIVYFAHSMRDYGSYEAQAAVMLIRDLYRKRGESFCIFDPEDLPWDTLGARLRSSSIADENPNELVFDWVIAQSHEIVALEHAGYVGRGVYSELERGLAQQKPCYVLRVESLQPHRLVPVKGLRLVDPEDWKVRYGAVEIAK